METTRDQLRSPPVQRLAPIMLVGERLVGRELVFACDFLDQDVEPKISDLQHFPAGVGRDQRGAAILAFEGEAPLGAKNKGLV